MSLRQELLQFVRELAEGTDAGDIDEEARLIDSGILDSIALLRLVTFVEERAGVRVPDEEVLPDNFQTIGSIEAMVDRLRS